MIKMCGMGLMVFALSAGCNNNASPSNDNDTERLPSEREGRVDDYDEDNDRAYGEAGDMDLQQFAKEAASDGMMEVEMADLILQKSDRQEVKDLARTIKQDHQNANEKLKDVAREVNMQLPNEMMEKHQKKMEELRDATGDNLDQKYVDMMVNGHQKVINKFERVADQEADNDQAEIRNWADNTLPALRKHYEQAQEVQRGMRG